MLMIRYVTLCPHSRYPRAVQSMTCPVRELTSPRVDQSVRCPVGELAIRELSSSSEGGRVCGSVKQVGVKWGVKELGSYGW